MFDWIDFTNPWHMVGIPLACGVGGWLAFGFGLYGLVRLADWLWPAKEPEPDDRDTLREP